MFGISLSKWFNKKAINSGIEYGIESKDFYCDSDENNIEHEFYYKEIEQEDIV